MFKTWAFKIFHGGNSTFINWFDKINFHVSLSHWCSTTVSLETTHLILRKNINSVGLLEASVKWAFTSEKQPVNYFSFVMLTSAGVRLLLNDVSALLFSLFYLIQLFDGSYMEDNVPEVGINQQNVLQSNHSWLTNLLKTVWTGIEYLLSFLCKMEKHFE